MNVNAKQAYERYFEYTSMSVPESWRRESGSTPADLHYYHAMNHYRRTGLWDNPFNGRDAQQQYELDVAMWYGTLTRGSSEETLFLRRLFTALYHGGMVYKGNQWATWASSNIPIAAAISHGGRVLIQLPKVSDPSARDFFGWLDVGTIISRNARLAATHGIEYLSFAAMQPLAAGRRHRVNEVKKGARHYGVNISLGGTGNRNPFSGNLIASNGEHGHLYVFYLPPTADNYGGVLVGCEGSAPIDSWDNRESVFHTKGSSGRSGYKGVIGLGATAYLRDKLLKDPTGFTPDQTGGYHKFGDRQRYSPTGNAKWEDVGEGPQQVYNGMIVDLVETGWEFLRRQPLFDPDNLGDSGPAPTQVVSPPMPRILTHTCLTEVNLVKMKMLTDQRAKDLQAIERGKAVTVKDYNAPKEADHKAPKPQSQIDPSFRDLAGSVEPDGREPMRFDSWTAVSNVRFSSRGTRIQAIDALLRTCLSVTAESLRGCREREGAGSLPGPDESVFVDRYQAVFKLAEGLLEYLKSTDVKSSMRAPAAEALITLALVERRLLLEAKRRITQGAAGG